MAEKYINNDKTLGIEIDWRKVFALYTKAIKHCTGGNINFYVPQPPMDKANWFVDLSTRSLGKTTCYLLLGLCIHKIYGCKGCEYIRLTRDGIAPKNSNGMFDVIRRFGYIPYIFGEQYNDIERVPRGWVLVKRDDNGEIIERSIEVVHMHSLEEKEVDAEKSVYNSDAVLIIVDEFMNVAGGNTENQFIFLCQLHSTIRRSRENVKCALLANTINKFCPWFSELEISDAVMKIKAGEEKMCKTSLGLNVWLHYAQLDDVSISEKRLHNNLKYYAFRNKRLNSITGLGDWETRVFPHVTRETLHGAEEFFDENRLYMRLNNKHIRLRFYYNDEMGALMTCEPYTGMPHDDSVVLVLDTPCKSYEYVGLPRSNIGKIIFMLHQQKRFYVYTNECGTILTEWLAQAGRI